MSTKAFLGLLSLTLMLRSTEGSAKRNHQNPQTERPKTKRQNMVYPAQTRIELQLEEVRERQI